ncbi:MAG: hypothetical protein QXN55_02555 [Candidatus Nitrosotenuis sp.]
MTMENFIDMCAVCKQGVPKMTMVYKNGRVFHQRCFETQGNLFPPINQELAQMSARTRIELVQMRNLKVRQDAGFLDIPKVPKKKTVKKAKAKKPKNAKKSKAKPKKAKRAKAKKSKRR